MQEKSKGHYERQELELKVKDLEKRMDKMRLQYGRLKE